MARLDQYLHTHVITEAERTVFKRWMIYYWPLCWQILLEQLFLVEFQISDPRNIQALGNENVKCSHDVYLLTDLLPGLYGYKIAWSRRYFRSCFELIDWVGGQEIFYSLSRCDPVILLRLIFVQLCSKERLVGKIIPEKNFQLSLHFATCVLHEEVNVVILRSIYKLYLQACIGDMQTIT